MYTRSTVLGKRGHQESSPAPAAEQLKTPEQTPKPKRARKSSIEDDDGNKENIPPFKVSQMNVETSPRAARALRRNSTETAISTPTRSRRVPRRTASVSSLPPATPSTDISYLAISTPPPTPPSVLVPLHARIRTLLRSTCNNTNSQIAGRETERATILEFLSSFIDSSAMTDHGSPTSMFISGSPGTGKTALVNAIIRDLSIETSGKIKVLSINCMALKGFDDLWERVIEDLGAPKRKSAVKLKGIDGAKSLLDSLSVKCILILDELDHITATTQSLSSIFGLTETIPSLLRLIGIANTHTLTSSSSSNAFISSPNVRTIHFAPYTPPQLQEILQSRLKSLQIDHSSSDALSADMKKFLPQSTLMLLTKKIATLTGDVRSLFEVLRGAIDLAVASPSKAVSGEDENLLIAKFSPVMPTHILASLKAYTPASATPKGINSSTPTSSTSNSETVAKILNLGLQARLLLLIILLASKRLDAGLSLTIPLSSSPKKGSASPMKRSFSLPNPATSGHAVGIETSLLYTYYSAILSRTELGIFEPLSRSEYGDLLGVLEGVGIVSLSSSLFSGISSSLAASPTKGKRTFNRSTSFGAGLGKHGAGAIGEVRLVEGVWGDEILRGLGVTGPIDGSVAEGRVEEVRGIWEREKSRLARDIKASASTSSNSNSDTFSSAFKG